MPEIVNAQVLVLGGGPGGYTAAIRAGQRGLNTVLIDAEGLGGTCLNRGCIPSKALLHAAEEAHIVRQAVEGGRIGVRVDGAVRVDLARTTAWKDQIVGRLGGGVAALLQKAGVRVLAGWGEFSDAKTCTVDTASGLVAVRAEHVILATGSEAAGLAALPFGGPVLSATEALALTELPKRLLIVGAGYIGLELGTAFAKLGASVTVVEAAGRILAQYDRQLTQPVRARLEQLGVIVHLGARAEGLEAVGDGAVATVVTAGGERARIETDKVLVTVGRRPRTSGWGLEAMAVDMQGSFVKVDGACRTSMRDVWAIGDLVGEPMLAHKASAQAEAAVESIAGGRRQFEPQAIPTVCFTDPQIVTVGVSREKGDEDLVVATFPFAASGRALGTGDGTGFVRVVARKADHVLAGVQAVGAQVSELSGQFATALEMGARLEDIADIIHAHPTRSEAFLEAAMRALGRPLHA